jgi:hypothetical protein
MDDRARTRKKEHAAKADILWRYGQYASMLEERIGLISQSALPGYVVLETRRRT